jgi:hypothetical protein
MDNFANASPCQVNLASVMHNLPSGAIANRGFGISTSGEAPNINLVLIWESRRKLMKH